MNQDEFTASFVVMKHAWRGKYLRVFSCGPSKLATFDLRDLFRVTNSWDTVSSIVSVVPDFNGPLAFTVSCQVNGKEKDMSFSCLRKQERSELLTCVHRQRMFSGDSTRTFHCEHFAHGKQFVPADVRISRIGMYVSSSDGSSFEMLFMHLRGFSTVEGQPNRIIFAYGPSLQLQMFVSEQLKELLNCMIANAQKYIGIPCIEKISSMTQEQFEMDRLGLRSNAIESNAEYLVTVDESTSRSSRLLCITQSALVERQADSYTPVKAVLLINIQSLVRVSTEDQKFLVEVKDPQQVLTYESPVRDLILAQIFSAARQSRNEDVCVLPQLTPRSLRFASVQLPVGDDVEGTLLHYLTYPEKLAAVSNPFRMSVEYFNANIAFSGLRFSVNREGFFSEDRERAIQDALQIVLVSGSPIFDRMLCIRRLCLTRAGFSLVASSNPAFLSISTILRSAVRHDDPLVVAAAMDLASVLVVSHHENYELKSELLNKTNILSISGFVPSVISLLQNIIDDESKVTVLQFLLSFLVRIMCPPYSETTPGVIFSQILDRLVEHVGRELHALLSHACADVSLSAAKIIRALMEESNAEQFAKLQAAATSECAFLQQFHVAAFSSDAEQRDVGRCLISYWAFENSKTQDLLRRMLPFSLLLLLQSTVKADITEQEQKVERGYEAATAEYIEKRRSWLEKARVQIHARREELAETSSPSLELRVRDVRLKSSLNWALLFAEMKKDHRRPDLIWNHSTRTELRKAVENELALFRANSSHGQGAVKTSWNYMEFEVDYVSLRSEVKIGDHYPRLLMEGSQPTIQRPKEFFNNVYHRFLLSTETDEKLFCLQCMTIVVEQYSEALGCFHDTTYFVGMLRECSNPLFRDSIVEFFFHLLQLPLNVKEFIDANGPQVLIDLLPLAHLDVDRPKTCVVANAIEALKQDAEQAQPKEWYYRLDDERHGPYSFAELKQCYMNGDITVNTTVWAQGQAGWRELNTVPQLKWGLVCSKMSSVLTFSQLVSRVLDILLKICRFYPSVDETGAIMAPLPKIKRFLTGPSVLPHVVQLLLTFDSTICGRVHSLLYLLFEANPNISRIYYTGLFYFALMYNGSDVLPLIQLFRLTHRQQSYKLDLNGDANEIIQSSILLPLLPPSMICALTLSEPESFAQTFLGNRETPEVVWNQEMRTYMISKIAAHITEFTSRLLSNSHAVYQYCPIGKIVYATLEKEVFCYEYYLRHLCDTVRFPDWKIRFPVPFLAELLARWKLELNKKPTSMTVALCCEELGVSYSESDPPTNEAVRHAYLKLLPVYHPDKNPEGREKFEAIQKAYEFFISERSTDAEMISRENLYLILKAQCILYRRCGAELSTFKYAGFRSLLQLIEKEMESAMVFHDEPLLIAAAVELCYSTVKNVPLNADELQEEGGIVLILSVLRNVLTTVSVDMKGGDERVTVAAHCVGVLAIAGELAECREAMKGASDLPKMIVDGLLAVQVPLLVENAVLACKSLSDDAQLREALIQAGVQWILLRLLLRFDATVENAGVELDGESHAQLQQNIIATSALASLAALVRFPIKANAPVTEKVSPLEKDLESLLTSFIMNQLRSPNSSPTEVLQWLTTNTDEPYFLWNNLTRSELLSLIDARCDLAQSGNASVSQPLNQWVYSSHKGVLSIDGVYVASYVSQPSYPIAKPKALFLSMCAFLETEECSDDDMLSIIQALKCLFIGYPAAAVDAARSTAIVLLRCLAVSNQKVLEELLGLHQQLVSSQEYVTAVESTNLAAMGFGQLLSRSSSAVAEKALDVFRLVCSNRGILDQVLKQKMYCMLLLVCLSEKSTQEMKELSAQCLSTIFCDKLVGPEVYFACSAFIPRVFLDAMKENWRSSAQLLCTWQTNPELCWSQDRKDRIEGSLRTLEALVLERWSHNEFQEWTWSPDELAEDEASISDIAVGGVYLHAYEQSPEWRVRNPKSFATALLQRFGEEVQKSPVNPSLLALLTTCLSLLIRKSSDLRDSVAVLGYVGKIVTLLSSPNEIVATTALQWLSILSRSSRCVEMLSKQRIIDVLMKFSAQYPIVLVPWLNTVEGITFFSSEKNTILQQSIDYHLVEHLLQMIDTSVRESVSDVDPTIVRALIIRIIKKLLLLPEPLYKPSLALLLKNSSVWQKYKDHSHDMFLGDSVSNTGELLIQNTPNLQPTLYLTAAQSISSEPPPF